MIFWDLEEVVVIKSLRTKSVERVLCSFRLVRIEWAIEAKGEKKREEDFGSRGIQKDVRDCFNIRMH